MEIFILWNMILLVMPLGENRISEREQQYQHTSTGENRSNTDDKTSSESTDVKREVTRPMPFAADQRTTVSYIPNR